jgi:hypothetical protein
VNAPTEALSTSWKQSRRLGDAATLGASEHCSDLTDSRSEAGTPISAAAPLLLPALRLATRSLGACSRLACFERLARLLACLPWRPEPSEPVAGIAADLGVSDHAKVDRTCALASRRQLACPSYLALSSIAFILACVGLVQPLFMLVESFTAEAGFLPACTCAYYCSATLS